VLHGQPGELSLCGVNNKKLSAAAIHDDRDMQLFLRQLRARMVQDGRARVDLLATDAGKGKAGVGLHAALTASLGLPVSISETALPAAEVGCRVL